MTTSSNLASLQFTKKNSFESKYFTRRLSTIKQQASRALTKIESQKEDPEKGEILSLAERDIRLQLSTVDENLKGASQNFAISELIAEEMARLDDEHIGEYIYHRYRYDVNPSEKVLDRYPPCVQIEPSSICNYRCKFCFQTNNSFSGKGSPHMGRMSLEDFKRAVDFIEGRVQIVSLASRGEPTLAKQFSEMMDYASSRFISLKVNTNASLLTEDLCHSLLGGNSKTIVLSIDAGSKEAYEELRVNGRFERIHDKLRMLKRIREKYYSKDKNIIRASGVFVGRNQSMEEMKQCWGEYVDQITFVKYNAWEDPYSATKTITNKPCSDLWRRLFIWHDLQINPCDTDYMSALSIGKLDQFKDLSEIWHSDSYERLRELHSTGSRGQLSPCKGCSLV